jgi:hypothetical protein
VSIYIDRYRYIMHTTGEVEVGSDLVGRVVCLGSLGVESHSTPRV